MVIDNHRENLKIESVESARPGDSHQIFQHWEAEAGGLQYQSGQSGLHVEPCFKTKTNKSTFFFVSK